MKRKFTLFALFYICSNLCISQNKYIQEGSIGKVTDKPDTTQKDCFTYRPIEEWVGEKFIFLPKTKEKQKQGYEYFSGGKKYVTLVGRICTIVDLKNDDFGDYYVYVKMDDDDKIYITKAYRLDESVSDIAPVADLDSARTRWLGKTLWLISDQLTTYDEKTDTYGTIFLKKYSPVKVINIVAGYYYFCPIRFIVQTPTGEIGYNDINLSGTNVSPSSRFYDRFSDNFLEEDPRITYNWSTEVWTAIENEIVFIGMTSKQAEMSRGKPESINKTIVGTSVHEQWVYYFGNYLYFENGILTAVQN